MTNEPELPMQSDTMTTNVSLNPAHTTLCDKVCQVLVTGWWFSPLLWFPPPIKLTTTI